MENKNPVDKNIVKAVSKNDLDNKSQPQKSQTIVTQVESLKMLSGNEMLEDLKYETLDSGAPNSENRLNNYDTQPVISNQFDKTVNSSIEIKDN